MHILDPRSNPTGIDRPEGVVTVTSLIFHVLRFFYDVVFLIPPVIFGLHELVDREEPNFCARGSVSQCRDKRNIDR